MTRQTPGGTRMWCPRCKQVSICTAVNPSQLGFSPGQLRCRRDHEDIQWFRRGRICQTCGHKFSTAEVNEQFIYELVGLRNTLSEIKTNADNYVTESQSAATALDRLTKSLNQLRSSWVFQQAKPTEPDPDLLDDDDDDEEEE